MPHPPMAQGDRRPDPVILAILLSALLAGCTSTPTVVRDRVATVSVPVIQKCADKLLDAESPLRNSAQASVDSTYATFTPAESWAVWRHAPGASLPRSK